MADEDKTVAEELEGDMLKAGMEEEKPAAVSLEVPTVPKPKGWDDADVLSQLRGAVKYLASRLGDQALKELKDLFPVLGD